MKTLALRHGDLVLTGDKYALVEGAARLQQQVGLALAEEYGADRFHPAWGSVLSSFVGTTYGASTPDYIRAEVMRVLRGYISLQSTMMSDRSVRAMKPNVTPSEIISDVSQIKIDQQQDSVAVKVTISTASQQQVDVLTTAGSV